MLFLPELLISGNITIRLTPAQGKGKLEEGSKFYIEVEAVNCQGEWKIPQSFGGAELLFTPSQNSTTMSTSDGYKTVTQRQESLTFFLLAKKAGTYTFGPVSVGNTKSKQLKYTIVEKGKGGTSGGAVSAGTASSSSVSQQGYSDKPQFIGRGNEDMFLMASVSKTSVYEQEALVYTIKLYTTYNYIKFLGATSAPKFDSFVVEETKITNANLHFETLNGKTYEAAEVARYIIFPQKAGKLTIKGNTYTVSADAFEYYHDPLFQQMAVKRPVELNLTPNDLIVDVRELPSPIPSDFSGGVGKFSIKSKLPDRNIRTNAASNIIYTVSGTGNLKYLKLPELKNIFPPCLETFTPEAEADTKVEGSNVAGKVVFTCSFMPVETGSISIPELKFVYFNPETGNYETATAEGYTFTVGKGSSSDRSQSALYFDSKLLPTDVSKIHKNKTLFVYSWGYWLWFIIPTILLVTALVMYRNYIRQHADMVGLKSRRAGKIAKRRLRKAKQCISRNDVNSFYDEMLAALWGFLSDKLKMPTSELSRNNVKEMLVSNGISEDATDKTIDLIDKCEFAKYAPSLGKSDMNEIYEKGAELIESLNSNFTSEKKKLS